MEVFNLLAKLVLDDKDFNTALSAAETKGENFSIKFGDIIKGIGDELNSTNLTAGLNRLSNWFVKSFDNTLKQADAIDKQSQALGISTEMYQKLDYAMSMSGSSVDSLSRGVKNINEILTGTASKSISEAFDTLGVSTEDAEGNAKTLEQTLQDVFEALSTMEDKTARDNLAEKLFGANAGQRMKAFLNEGEKGIKGLMAEADELGLVMTDEQIKEAVKAGDERQKLQEVLTSLTNQVMIPFMPVVSETLSTLTPLIAGTVPLLQTISSGLVWILQKLGLVEDPDKLAADMAWQSATDETNVSASGGDYTRYMELAMGSGGTVLDENEFNQLYAQLTAAADDAEELGDSADDTAGAVETLGAAAESAAANLSSIPASGGLSDDQMDEMESIFGYHASGMWSVPQDGYRAVLHRDEMILNASRANDYRNGEGGGSSAVVAAIQALRNDMQNLRLVVGQKTFGRAVVDYGGSRMDGYIGQADSALAAGYGS